MKFLLLNFFAVTLLVSFSACQKELNYAPDGVSVGSLKNSSTGDCLPATLYGIYRKDSVLTTDNYIDVQVSTIIMGTFDARTDTVNGFSFSKTGNVGTGLNTIRLYASGTPLGAGTYTFTITYGSSHCKFPVIVQTSGAGSAIYTMGGNPGTCSGFTANGIYSSGVTMNALDSVTMLVNVTAIGTYILSTDTLNGVYFAGYGTFTNPGVQTVTLKGQGTPLAANAVNYTVNAGGTSCKFSIIYTNGGPPGGNQEYVPETVNSNWTLQLVGGTITDTTYTLVTSNTALRNGQTYKVFQVDSAGIPKDSSFHRSSSGKYYKYYYNNLGIFDNPINTEILLLDSVVALNGTWSLALPPNSVSGLPVNARIDAKVIARGATAVVFGNSYANIIKVQFTYMVDIGIGFNAAATEEFWYSKGYGLIDDKMVTTVPVPATIEYIAKRIQIF